MTDYISPSIPISRGEVKQRMVDEFTARTGAVVAAGTTWDVFFDVIAGVAGDIGEEATEVTNLVFRRYGEVILKILPKQAVPATGTVTFTAVDTSGPYLVPAGTELSVAGLDGGRVSFYTNADATVPFGSLTVVGIPVVAGVLGEAGNGLTADAQLEASFEHIASVALTVATSGGVEAETDDEYINRLADESPLQAITLVLPDDFARYARNFPGVATALPIDLYNADTATANEPGAMTVAVRDASGHDPGSLIRTALQTALEDLSVSDLDVYVIPATYTNITVTLTVVALPGFDSTDVNNRAGIAVNEFLNPAAWGIPRIGEGRVWVDTPIVRYQDLVTVINNVEGVSHYTSLLVNGGTSDVTLAGPAATPLRV